jgi:hypothetical protein
MKKTFFSSPEIIIFFSFSRKQTTAMEQQTVSNSFEEFNIDNSSLEKKKKPSSMGRLFAISLFVFLSFVDLLMATAMIVTAMAFPTDEEVPKMVMICGCVGVMMLSVFQLALAFNRKDMDRKIWGFYTLASVLVVLTMLASVILFSRVDMEQLENPLLHQVYIWYVTIQIVWASFRGIVFVYCKSMY